MLTLILTLAADSPQAPVPATVIIKTEHEAVLEQQIEKAVVVEIYR